MIRRISLTTIAVLVAAAALSGAAQAAKPGDLSPLNTLAMPPGAVPASSSGYVGGEPSAMAISQNGRYVAFPSDAESLAPGSDPNVTNIYRKDRVTGAVALVSRRNGPNGAGTPRDAWDPRISDDGNLVSFITEAPLSPADVNGEADVYLRDIAAGTTTLATPGLASGLAFGNHDLSGDGAFIAFATDDALDANDTNGVTDVYRRNLSNGETRLASARNSLPAAAGNGASRDPSISGDGRWVAFASAATDLIVGFGNNNTTGHDVFARDMEVSQTFLVSRRDNTVNQGGDGHSRGPKIAGTPTTYSTLRVAFSSSATDLDDPGLDPDTSAQESVYLRSLEVGINFATLVSRADGPGGANADSRAHLSGVSDSGNRATFYSDATNLHLPADYYGAYVRDLNGGRTALVGDNNSYTVEAAISGDGAYTTWLSGENPTGDSDKGMVGVYGRGLGGSVVPPGPIEHISRPAGSVPYLMPVAPVLPPETGAKGTTSADGRYVVFVSAGPRLPGSTPDRSQVYRRDVRCTGGMSQPAS